MKKEYDIANIENNLIKYLNCEARKKLYSNQPITLRYDSKSQSIIDQLNCSYRIDMDQLASFSKYFRDNEYKFIRLHDWHFQTKFEGKLCKMITLNAQFIVLIQNKTKTANIKDCPFRVFILDEENLQKSSKQLLGYLNRIGKRNLVYQSDNVQKQIPNLTSFANSPKKLQFIERISIIEHNQQQQIDPLKLLNKNGIDLLEKLTHFIPKNNIIQFMRSQQLSEQGSRKLRRLIFPQNVKKGKKTFGRNIIQQMMNNYEGQND